ncbi:ABC transporter permease [Scatolibacter rhodanostii]|uniref:ABC transporter permease n=1 Tax=Scatolibacter rhodanostii TaxID=2014781 RepID=UPI000C06B298|nr:ABC transporter permease subunit [Scatolibacter rhodanostii]
MSAVNELVPVKTKKQTSARKFKQFFAQLDLQLLVIPSIIIILIFSYIPMYGVLMGFQNFKLGDFPGFSEWVGLKHFNMLAQDPYIINVIRNTLVISSLKLVICFPLPIIFAVILSEIKISGFVRVTNTISYLPHFISWVVASTLIFDMLSVDYGLVNTMLVNLKIIDAPISFFTEGKYFWAITVVTDVWKELGWNAIIYTAAVTAVDTEMYEAAAIDGVSRWQRIRYITSAAIKPTIIITLIFTVGGILNANFDQIMLLTKQMSNGLLRDYADVIDTYIYRVGLREGRHSFSAAAGLVKSVINFLLLVAANAVARKTGETSLF